MNVNKYMNKNLVIAGIGSLGAMVGAGMLARYLTGKTKGFNQEVAGVATGVIGSLMLTNKNKTVKGIGTGVGSVGFALAGKGVYDKVKSNNLIALPAVDNSEIENTDDENFSIEDNYPNWSDYATLA